MIVDVKNYVCDICGAAYKDQSHLTKHTKEVHLGVYQYHCEKCGHGMRKKERYKVISAHYPHPKKYTF